MKSQRTGNKTIAIIQARMASKRLPGKVLLDLDGQPDLVRVVERVRRAHTLDGFIIATTTDLSDEPLIHLCSNNQYPSYRGSQYDVLDRFYQAAHETGADVIVRITADCPLIDPGLIDEAVHAFYGMPDQSLAHPDSPMNLKDADPPFDFAANRLPPPWKRTYPIGLDVEVFTFNALERAWKEANQPFQREHVTPYFYEYVRSRHFKSLNELQAAQDLVPGQFKVLTLDYKIDYGSLRWTLDTPEDLAVLRQVFAHFAGRDDFSWLEVLALFNREPGLAQMNAAVTHKDYRESELHS